jgi:hypothetical protein
VSHNGRLGRVGRAAECTRLESGRRESVRGFKSLTLRHWYGAPSSLDRRNGSD